MPVLANLEAQLQRPCDEAVAPGEGERAKQGLLGWQSATMAPPPRSAPKNPSRSGPVYSAAPAYTSPRHATANHTPPPAI